MKKFDDKFLLDELKRFKRENGRVPKQRDFCKKNGYISSRTYCDYFGSWNNALSLAGLTLNRFVGYTDDQLLSELQRFVDENDRVPFHDDFINNPDYPSAPTYVTHFGSWNQALQKANLKLNRSYNRDPEFLLDEIQRFTDTFGRTPYCRDMTAVNGFPSMNVYVDVFGSWNSALAKAGIDAYTSRIYSKDMLIAELHRFKDEFERVPGTRDMDNTPGYPSTRPYKKWFGSYNAAILEAGLDVNTFHDYTPESLIAELIRFVEENGRTPSHDDMKRCNGYCSSGVYIRVFGSWNAALIAAGLEINKVRSYDYSSNITCELCDKLITDDAFTNNDDQLICRNCRVKQWRKDNPDKYYAEQSRHRGYGFLALNNKFRCSDAHHLHIEERSDFTVYIPSFIHKMFQHSSTNPETMGSINAIALDYFVNESMYKNLYLTGEV